jgi:nitrous oxidase accessory protein
MKAFVSILLTLMIFSMDAPATSIEASTIDQIHQYFSGELRADTIYIDSGIYTGLFTIEYPAIVIGQSGTVLDGQEKGDVLTIAADSVIVADLSIQNSGTRLLKDYAGIKITGDNVNVIRCEIINNLHGIYIKGGNSVHIYESRIVGRSDLQEADRGNGIHLWNTRNNLIFDNEISYARDGIYFSFAHNTKIRSNRIHHLRYGLHYMYSDSNSFEDNLFVYNVAGSALMYSKEIDFTRNIFAHCRGFRAYGVLLQSVEYCRAKDNLILDNSQAVFFDDANHNSFYNNDIVQNDLAVRINASCEDNRISANNFVSNLTDVVMDASVAGSTYWSDSNSGNYWSSYSGYDLDFDNIGDIPHTLQSIFEYMEEDNPTIRFYLYSPAAQLLAAAEERLPILRSAVMEDKYPLFKRKENETVPWSSLSKHSTTGSMEHSALWLIIIFMPSIYIWRLRK